MKENKERFSVSMDPELLGKLDRVCALRGEPRSAIIERLVRNAIPEELQFLEDMENPVYRALLVAMKSSPKVMEAVNSVAGVVLSDGEMKKQAESAAVQMDRGKDRERERKGRRPKKAKK